MPLARTQIGPVRRFLGLDAASRPGETPDATEFNDYLASIPPTYEQERENAILSAADERAEALTRHDLETAEAVRGARNRGFQGSYPLQEQAEYEDREKLKRYILPEQMKLEAEMQNRAATREFNAAQSKLDRESRERIAGGTQAGQNDRAALQRAEVNARAVEQGRTPVAGTNPLRKFLGWLPGVDSNEDIRGREAARIRSEALTNGSTGGETPSVLMEGPDGSRAYVSPSQVQMYISKGGRVVE